MTPSALYRAEVSTGEIQEDPSQLAALEHFDRLHEQILKSLDRNWFQKLRQRAVPKGLYLWGGVGTGKTLLMDIFYSALPDGVARRIQFHRFMQFVHDKKGAVHDQQNPLRIIASDLARKHRVLCLDEFAVTDITDAMILYGLLDALFDDGVALVTTSNIAQAELYKNGLQRDRFLPAIKLLQTFTEEVHVDSGNDYRMAYLRDDSIYHYPLDQTSERALADCFSQLAGHHEDSKSSIYINGREVQVVATGSGVAWFEFEILCEGHRSRMDYIELSKRFHTLILANVPELNDLCKDASRRLIELVDELYDRGVNLIISAATNAESLYSGKSLSQPFKRTVSRLQEMASLEYIARPHLP
ncbi:MAG: cell division protein ZapE [Gammaproteobacteria bacterium]